MSLHQTRNLMARHDEHINANYVPQAVHVGLLSPASPSDPQMLAGVRLYEHRMQSTPDVRALLANLCAQFIADRFPYHYNEGSGVQLYGDILYLLREVPCDSDIAYGALLILERVREAENNVPRRVLELPQYEIFLAAYVLSYDFLANVYNTMDDIKGQKLDVWDAFVQGELGEEDIGRLQRQMGEFLDWNVFFTGDQLSALKQHISEEFGHEL